MTRGSRHRMETVKPQLSVLKEAVISGAMHACPAAVVCALIWLGELVGILPGEIAGQLKTYAWWLVLILLSCYVSFGIASRTGNALGIMAGLVCAVDGCGLIGALLGGIIAGYLTELFKKLRLPAMWRAPLTMFIIPLIGGFVLFMIMHYLIDPPLLMLNEWIKDVLCI